MICQPTAISDDLCTLLHLPGWVTSARPETPEDVAFRSGAALNHLHLVLSDESVPHTLLRQRLALRVAEACVAYTGRVERAGELRDELAFLQPGDRPGPSGEIYKLWQRAVEREIGIGALNRALLEIGAEQIGAWLDAQVSRGAGQASPVGRAAAVLEAVIRDDPRAISAALLLADATLSQSLKWGHVVPLVSLKLKRTESKLTGDDLRLACHKAISVSVVEALREAADLTGRAAKLNAIAAQAACQGIGWGRCSVPVAGCHRTDHVNLIAIGPWPSPVL
jgi:hypothetical protein